jgi:hypothetical protein
VLHTLPERLCSTVYPVIECNISPAFVIEVSEALVDGLFPASIA